MMLQVGWVSARHRAGDDLTYSPLAKRFPMKFVRGETRGGLDDRDVLDIEQRILGRGGVCLE